MSTTSALLPAPAGYLGAELFLFHQSLPRPQDPRPLLLSYMYGQHGGMPSIPAELRKH